MVQKPNTPLIREKIELKLNSEILSDVQQGTVLHVNAQDSHRLLTSLATARFGSTTLPSIE